MLKIDWKARALDRAKLMSDEVETYICPATELEIGFCVGDETFPFVSSGTCCECGMDFHIIGLKMRDGMDASSWPVHYEGCYCKGCYYADDKRDDVELEDPIEFEGEEDELEGEEEAEDTEVVSSNI